jgi:opacity protein-like surface antigen
MLRRSLLVLALLGPAEALAAARPPWAGLLVGYEAADFAGLSLRVDGELPVRSLGPKVVLSLVGSLGYSRLTWDPGFDVEARAGVIKVVPAARLTVPLAARLSVFGDAGLGLAHVSTEIDFPATANAAGLPDSSSSTFNALVRVGAGAWYQVTEPVRLGVLLELDPILGDFGFRSSGVVTGGSQSTLLVQAGLMVRL